MTHTYSKLIYHLIWSTKTRKPFIQNDFKKRIYAYIRKVIEDKEQQLFAINGMPDHIHLLVGLSIKTDIADFVRDIKVSSTKWMKSKEINVIDFAWQEGYSVFTVGYSTFNSVVGYINNQEEHHKAVTFEEEYIKFLESLGIKYDPRFVLG